MWIACCWTVVLSTARPALANPLSVDDVATLLSAVSLKRVAALIEEKGIAFEPTDDVKAQLRAAGADDAVIEAVDRADDAADSTPIVAATAVADPTGKPPDGMVFVGAGPFFMGCNEKTDPDCADDEKPGRTVQVESFWIDKNEVTVADFRRCVTAGHCSTKRVAVAFWDGHEQPKWSAYCEWQRAGRENHPINCVDWNQAVEYCKWRGKRLPTEAEWEKAAGGTDKRRYPWGNAKFGAAGRVANIADETMKQKFPDAEVAVGYTDGYVDTAPVGSFPAGASPYGALDMVGNVWEWVADQIGQGRAARGGSWYDPPRDNRVSSRDWFDPTGSGPTYGFRCAQ